MFQFDIVDLIPQSLKRQAVDAAVDFVSDQAKKFLSDEFSNKIKKLRSDAAFQAAFAEGLQRAANRFASEYAVEDEDVVATLVADKTFFQNQEIQQALLAILKKPGIYLAEEQEVVAQSFDSVLPTRLNRERVNRAVIFFLKCLAEEVWNLPELRPAYELQFQRMTAEAIREQVNLQRTQLQATAALSTDIRDALLQLTDAIAERKLLPGGDTLALPVPKKVYHNLSRPDYERFVGRKAELSQIGQLLLPKTRHFVVTIDGIGGIGKSALALEVAHSYLRYYDRLPEEERFEAIIWTSAKQTVLTGEGIATRSQALRTLDDIYTTIAVTLEREDITRARADEQDELTRHALAQQRTLLIVDNLETVDDERVMTFIREVPDPTKVIVTTRHRLDIAYPVRLVGMNEADALILIADEAKKKGVTLTSDEARRLYQRTGGVPLAIVWSVAQMGFGYGVEAVLTRLGQPTSDIAKFCFEGAVERIKSKPTYKLLLALSLFATDASREALGYVADLPELDRDEGLVELEKLSLINKINGRFQLLPLTKSFALAESILDWDNLRQRWLNWATEFIKSLGVGSEVQLAARFDEIDLENENIKGILQYAYDNWIWLTILRICRLMGWYWYSRGQWIDQRYWLERTIEATREFIQKERALTTEEKTLMGAIYNCYGWMLLRFVELCQLRKPEEIQSDYEIAEDAMQNGLTISKSVGDKNVQAYNLRNLGILEYDRKNFEVSQAYYEEALKIWQELRNPREIASCNTRLGELFNAKGDYEKAKNLIKRGLRTHTEMKDEDRIGAASIRLADVFYNLGQWEDAKKYYRNGQENRKSFEAYQNIIRALTGLSKIAVIQGEFDLAIQRARQALVEASKLGIPKETLEVHQILETLNVS